MPTYIHVQNIYLFMYNYIRWWRFREPSPFCSLTFYSFSEKEISEKGAYALREALRVNHSLRKLEWVLLLMSYTCTKVVLWSGVYLSDHICSWLIMMDLMRALHLWLCKNCKSMYVSGFLLFLTCLIHLWSFFKPSSCFSFSDILQPQQQLYLSWWCVCTSWSIANEPEPSET